MPEKTAFVAGASTGFHVSIFARQLGPLEEARKEIESLRVSERQELNATSVDLGDSVKVNEAFRKEARLPDVLYCVAGGVSEEIGYINALTPKDFDSCMRKNYFTSVYATKAVLDIWESDEKENISAAETTKTPFQRQVVYIASAAAFLGLPGYGAYTASKCAIRGFADTLRMEMLRLSSATRTYSVHCAFPGNFVTDSFLKEQLGKPELLKKIEGSLGTEEELRKRFPSVEKVARLIVEGVVKGKDFALCDDSPETAFLWSNMVGPSPKRGLGIVDSVLSVVVGLIVWPILRRSWDRQCRQERNK